MPNPLDIWGVLGTHCGFHLGRSILIFTKGIIMKAFTNNAADASPEAIEVSGHWSHGELRLVIRDFGPGLSQEILQMAGEPFFTTTVGRGMSLGLYLSRIILERFGGKVSLSNHSLGGSLTTVLLPLNGIAATQSL